MSHKGRIERTLFTRGWVNDEELRKTPTAELNKSKAERFLQNC
ncbi:Tn3 family transposase [Brucella pseudogrignonensis]